jgi:hypothetical protein
MKKSIFILALMPCLCLAKIQCPIIPTVKIVCKQDRVKTIVYLYRITTKYHKAFPECKINDPRMVTQEGHFRIDHIARQICGLNDLNKDKSVHFSMGRNWFFGWWLPSIPMVWDYTPETHKYEVKK